MRSIRPIAYLKLAVETAVTRAHVWFVARRYKDDALARLVAAEFPVQRRANDLAQRQADRFWKKYYAGRPERDPQFRREERRILQRVFEEGLNREQRADELAPLWKRYHAKQVAEQPQSAKTPERPRVVSSLHEAYKPHASMPEVFQTYDEELRRTQPTKPGSRILQQVQNRLQTAQPAKRSGKGQGRGL